MIQCSCASLVWGLAFLFLNYYLFFMHIYWHGQNCFKIVSGDVTLITDPFGKNLGLKPPRTSASIVTLSNNDTYSAEEIKDNPLIFNTPGEYEAKGVLMHGLWSYRDKEQGKKRGLNYAFTIELENIRICHLGDIGHLLDEKLESKIDGVDILMIPIGGHDTIDAKTAAKIVQQIEPGIVIPMHYKLPGLKTALDDLKPFLKEMGAQTVKPMPKLRTLKKLIPIQKTEVVALSPV